MSIDLTEQQKRGIAALTDWWRNRRTTQQVFRVFGFAGTGKTTLIEKFLAEIGVGPMQLVFPGGGGAVFGAYTGKAALNMRQRSGVAATTIHKLLYLPQPENEQRIRQLQEEIENAGAELDAAADISKPAIRTRLAELKREFDRLVELRFEVNENAPARSASVIVIDEVSMVGAALARDLLSLGVPIIVLGDPGQLPPVKDESGEDTGYFMSGQPDVMLTEIHRQAEDSPIIQLSMMAREGREIPFAPSGWGGAAWKFPASQIVGDNFLGADQIITGMHKTRHSINNGVKRQLGLSAPYPTGDARERVICERNYDVADLINGQFMRFENVTPVAGKDGDIRFTAEIVPEGGEPTAPLRVYKGFYDDHLHTFNKTAVEDRARRDHLRKKGLVLSSWGWCITVHKAQGSQWPRVMVWDDRLYAGGRFADRTMRARWLYTAITRAEKELVIVA